MLEKLITFALQQRVFVLIATAALVLAGSVAWSNLPIEASPDVQDVQVQVVTQALGLAPEEVERAITLPIEREMSGVARMTQLRSVSIMGLSIVTLTFLDGTDDYFARQQTLEKLQNVNLPPGINASIAPLTNAVGEVFRYVIEAPATMPAREVRALQDWVIRPALRTVPGIADVIGFGGEVKEYQVRIKPYLLRKYNVTIDQVAKVLTSNSANSGGGVMRRGDEALVIRGIGLFQSLDDIGRVVIETRQGRGILVSDVAEVAIGPRPLSGMVAFNERGNVVQGIVQMTKGQNATTVVGKLKKEIEDLDHKLPEGVRLVPYYDRTLLVDHTVHTVVENLLVGALLVVAILIVFLRSWQAALAVATVIPLSLLFAFILMDLRGVSANLISLGGVDFGIIIDSAVVLVEALMVRLATANPERFPQQGHYPWRIHALKKTAIELGTPILFSKGIIILAFMPIFTFQRVEGKIFSPMAFTLTFALLGAVLLTLTLIPVLMSYAIKNGDLAEKHSDWMHSLQVSYLRLLMWSQDKRRWVVSFSVGLLVITLLLSPRLGSEFLPKLDEGNIWLTITLPPATALEKTKEVEQRVRTILTSYPEINNVITQVGRPDDGTDPKGFNNLEVMADLNDKSTWRPQFHDKESLIAAMEAEIHKMPGVPTNFSQVIQDNLEEALSGVKGEIAVKIYGPDLEILEDKSEQIADVLRSIKGATDVAAIKIGGQTELNIILNREQMARYGLNVADVNSTIQTALAGDGVNVFYEGDRRFDVTLRLSSGFRDAVDDVADLPINLPPLPPSDQNHPNADNAPVDTTPTIPLGSIADIQVKQGAGRISRENGGRLVAVKANLVNRDQGGFVEEAMAKVNEQVKLPPGYEITWGGQFENQQRAVARLKIIVPISVMLIFVLLFWAFRSTSKAVLVLLMVPFTFIGGFAGLGLAGLHMSVSAAVGFIAVAGISVQNGVIMVEEFMLEIMKGKSVIEAVLDGAVTRLRAILMTALMAGLGLLPAALSHGAGSETQRPFAVVIVGGIVSGTIFTLLLLPMLFPKFADEARRGYEQQ
ncbi:MAG: CusA/CzcA family heavy metal efflux RND transporter [Gallionella sp.]|nr:CusA/CzcA family heavy metal efflux RND transporter [Gallionella sp.]MDD4957886.1 CusA/CzcA family heavy metal efflux RND transporter [Gallionella sp.]